MRIYHRIYAPSEDSHQRTHPYSDHSVHCLFEGTFDNQLAKECPANTLIRSYRQPLAKRIQLSLVISNSLISNNRLSRNTAYLEVKIWSPPKHENLTRGKKYCGKEEKGAISLFQNIFNISLTSKSNYTYICQMWLFELFFPQFCKSDLSRYG